jgi:hypothetical protein
MAKNQGLTQRWYQRDWTFIAGFALLKIVIHLPFLTSTVIIMMNYILSPAAGRPTACGGLIFAPANLRCFKQSSRVEE